LLRALPLKQLLEHLSQFCHFLAQALHFISELSYLLLKAGCFWTRLRAGCRPLCDLAQCAFQACSVIASSLLYRPGDGLP
jgi:hypothetical protein